ncbi:hypothetical protein CHARACLAT_003767 [Characodon lateralis]|uniref:Uncharacterized protein n=1 Tax=Characodon lateralis TaxID=208331 RepID=A0ABU7ETY0_9TELE|nr:hypothetical protein [Characodon lateralis]
MLPTKNRHGVAFIEQSRHSARGELSPDVDNTPLCHFYSGPFKVYMTVLADGKNMLRKPAFSKTSCLGKPKRNLPPPVLHTNQTKTTELRYSRLLQVRYF